MMERTYSLIHPDLLTITEGERTWRRRPEWFGDEWQRKAGCVAYGGGYAGELSGADRPLPGRPALRELGAMMDVTGPDGRVGACYAGEKRGVNTCLFTKGFVGFAAQKACRYPYGL